ncbi:lasso peptide biosynthesis B2 protein [Leptolyngbya cf. ectocarpi LEGE 11479]|uniref:Lasso peptide biosynthesis B2 protein n=1 Tax=Leptolyngbya cf. ectocarpi LEGE 11479 TaxID=1828722 RepID=A0A928ZTI9_LEPEC|nr:lasso peptide biosynthesis B2 protein [Leptolyngbya ectocarpi]MBE9065714.1 lasso peptide biosynthesis B2 protein [Leptolyngbya cf. ectocarpi LEGE 11479]
MRRPHNLKKLLKLVWRQRQVLFYACLCLNLLRVALWLLPFKVVRQHLATMATKWERHQSQQSVSVNAIVWSVTVASCYTPHGAKCLAKALTTQLLLTRYGYTHQLHIGVAMDGAFEAHAWIEYEDRVIMGGLQDLSRFQSLSRAGVTL